MNPEYEQADLLKAMKWAVWSTVASQSPTSVVAVIPRWKKGAYMNLLRHRNVKVVARYARDTFSFSPPDHWAGKAQSGRAKWQVMVVQIANDAGREKYRVGDPTELLREAGLAMGAKPIETECIDTGGEYTANGMSREFKNAPYTLRSALRGGNVQEAGRAPVPEQEGLALRFPSGSRIFTDGSMDQDDNVGAAVYDELTDEVELTGVPGAPTVLRAELVAILIAIRRAEKLRNLQIFSDSLTAIRLIRRWAYCPHELTDDNHIDVLDDIGQAIAERQGEVRIYKVRAHVGNEGNEKADEGAKEAAARRRDNLPLTSPDIPPREDGTRAHKYKAEVKDPGGESTPIYKPKQQLREVTKEWLMTTKDYKRTVLDMWTNPTEPHGLDAKASNSMWGTSKTWETWGILQILRTRFLELVTPHMLAKRSRAPTDTLPSETRCELCNRDYANWFHMLMTCRHPDVTEYYTARHNAAGRQILHFLKRGGLGRFAILTNFGRIDGDPEQPTVPNWMLGEEGRRRILERPEGDRGIKPDFVVLEGWPANAPLPTEPTTAWRGENGHTRAVKLHIGEVGFCSDLEHTAKYEAKAAHYAPLAEELTSAGWQVHHTIHVLTVGVRATVPLRNLEVLEGLQMPKKDREELQSSLAKTATKHAGIIIARLRRLYTTTRRAAKKMAPAKGEG